MWAAVALFFWTTPGLGVCAPPVDGLADCPDRLAWLRLAAPAALVRLEVEEDEKEGEEGVGRQRWFRQLAGWLPQALNGTRSSNGVTPAGSGASGAAPNSAKGGDRGDGKAVSSGSSGGGSGQGEGPTAAAESSDEPAKGKD